MGSYRAIMRSASRIAASIGWRVIVIATMSGLAVLIPAAVVASLILGDDANPWWAWVFVAVAVFAFLASGFVAGLLRSDTPMLHGAVAALAAATVMQGAAALDPFANGERPDAIAVTITAMIALSCGVGGSLFAEWFSRRRRAGTW